MVLYTYEEEKKALLEEKEKLENEIHAIREMEELKRSQRYLYSLSASAYRRMPVRFLKSVYHTRRDALMKYASLTFDSFMLKRLFDLLKEFDSQGMIEYLVLCCKDMVKCDSGYELTLFDPYRTIKVRVDDIPGGYPEYKIKNHILQIKAIIGPDFFKTGEMRVEAVRPLPYTLEEEERNGIARPIETRDYDMLKDLEKKNGLSNKAACLNMAQELVHMGGRRSLPEEQQEEHNNGFVYVRGKFKKYFLFFNHPEIEAMVYESGGLVSFEISGWNRFEAEAERRFDPTYLPTIKQ